jgi:hypothetical protein
MGLYNCALYVIIVGLFFLPGLGASDEVWHITTVETVPDSDKCEAALALDNNGKPGIVYFSDADLKYAYFDGSTWQSDLVGGCPGGEWCSIAFDSLGHPHISYYAYTAGYGGALYYGYRDASGWSLTLVDYDEDLYDVGLANSIALDSYDRPHISYSEYYYEGGFLQNNLKYAFWDGYEWNVDMVEYSAHAWATSIALNADDKPYILYSDNYGYEVIYAELVGTDWELEVVEDWYDMTEIRIVSLVLDWNDNAHISYVDEGCLKYARQSDLGWDIEELESIPYLGGANSVNLDSNNNPHISYTDGTPSVLDYTYWDLVLMYLYWDGSIWQSEEVYSLSSCYTTVPIVLDAYDIPHIAYASDNQLLYANRLENTPPSSFNLSQPPDGAEVSEPVTLDWEDSTDDDGHDITYDVWYATDPSFDPHDEVTELTDSTYTFPEDVLTQGETYYWKVRAWDGYDETWSGPDPYWSFTVEEEVTGISVTNFSAESARTGVELTWECAEPGVGFNLYRSEEATGIRTKSLEMLNAELITGESPYSYLDTGVSDGVTYAYWLEVMDPGGASETFGPATCTAGTFVPSSYALYQSRPNPARGTAVIAFDLSEDADVTLTIYDLSGRKVTTLVDETLPAGAYERPVSGLAPGVYVYRLEAGEFSGVRKMVVIE